MSFCTSIRKSCQPKRKIGRGLNKAFHLKEHKILIGRKKKIFNLSQNWTYTEQKQQQNKDVSPIR